MWQFSQTGGTYTVIFRVDRPGQTIDVGALSSVRFDPGFYVYVGSALNGLQPRLDRHLRSDNKRMYWHVDYLRRHAKVVGALGWATNERCECELSAVLSRRAGWKIAGFGASDCDCPSHLFGFNENPLVWLRGVLLEEGLPRRSPGREPSS